MVVSGFPAGTGFWDVYLSACPGGASIRVRLTAVLGFSEEERQAFASCPLG